MTLPHRERRARLIASFPETIDALLVTRLVNVRYLSGFTGSNAALLVSRSVPAVIATDGRYLTQVAAEAPDLECVEVRAVADGLVERAVAEGVARLGIEAAHVTLATYDALRAAAADRLAFVAVCPLVEPLRMIKDSAELAALRRACDITDRAFADLTGYLRAGVTERDVAWRLESSMREHGASGVAFETIAAFGPNSAIPHHQPTDRQLAPGDFVKVDFGALYDGYHADLTRTVVLGRAADWQRELHQLVQTIQRDCVASCVVGVLPAALNGQAAAAIEASGHRVAHGLGHGVGLAIHEDPFLTSGSGAGALVPDVALTIEPGIYLEGRGGVRVEDTLVLTDGGPTSLTSSPRELIEL